MCCAQQTIRFRYSFSHAMHNSSKDTTTCRKTNQWWWKLASRHQGKIILVSHQENVYATNLLKEQNKKKVHKLDCDIRESMACWSKEYIAFLIWYFVYSFKRKIEALLQSNFCQLSSICKCINIIEKEQVNMAIQFLIWPNSVFAIFKYNKNINMWFAQQIWILNSSCR